MKSILDVVERESFTVAYDQDSSDPNQSHFTSNVAKESQVKAWERAPILISLSNLLDHAVSMGGPTQAFTSTETVLTLIGDDRKRTNARHVAEKYDDRPLNDPRFDSVVAIYTAKAMGSGFYVRSNIIMTNWHVVEKQPIVELRMFDKRETFGQVIAKDVLLDLALVKVQERGRPVEFFQGKELAPGDSVDAIGHPEGHLFTITRGIISAIRKVKPQTNPTQSGKNILYIQTDADVNHGNSGGPLFMGDKVVGINTFITQNAPGLNFAIHYSEAKKFLDESMRGGD